MNHRHEASYRFPMITGTGQNYHGILRTLGTCNCGVAVVQFHMGSKTDRAFRPTSDLILSTEPLGPEH